MNCNESKSSINWVEFDQVEARLTVSKAFGQTELMEYLYKFKMRIFVQAKTPKCMQKIFLTIIRHYRTNN